MAKNTIILKNYLNNFEEFTAIGVITPGNLLEITSAGKVQRHSAAGSKTITILALEDNLQGKDINGDYAVGDKVQTWIPQTGDQAYMLLANGESVVKGDALTSNGDGTLKKFVAASSAAVIEAPEVIVAISDQALDMSGSSAVDPSPRIEVRIA